VSAVTILAASMRDDGRSSRMSRFGSPALQIAVAARTLAAPGQRGDGGVRFCAGEPKPPSRRARRWSVETAGDAHSLKRRIGRIKTRRVMGDEIAAVQFATRGSSRAQRLQAGGEQFRQRRLSHCRSGRAGSRFVGIDPQREMREHGFPGGGSRPRPPSASSRREAGRRRSGLGQG